MAAIAPPRYRRIRAVIQRWMRGPGRTNSNNWSPMWKLLLRNGGWRRIVWKDDVFRRSLARPGGWAGFAWRHKRGRRRSFAKTVRRLNASLLRRERLDA